MKLSGEQLVSAPKQRVWDGLNDPEVLKACIPGCEHIEQKSATELEAVVTAKVGPVKAKFAGEVTLSDLDPPNSYRITGQGKGGVAGFAKGGALVTLEEVESATKLTYEVEAQVGGKIASLGGRLIDATAKKMADDFFTKFSQAVATEEEEAPSAEVAPSQSEESQTKIWIYLGIGLGLLALVAIFYYR